jgi:PAS domain S-box-containing protein
MIENLKPEVIEAMLDSMPTEISFVNENDEVKYFNKNGDRIFPRPRSIVGKKVQQCHPQKSLHKVLQILEAFKDGKKDVAEFWINLKGRQIYIRYFAVRDKAGKYLGTLEVSQDITDIKKIEGEKRLLDWQ